MDTYKLIFSFTAISLLFSCSNSSISQETTDSSIVKAKDSVQKIQPRLSKDNKPNIPVSSEDSLKVFTYKQLQSYMPQITGYKKGLTGGETLSNATSGGRQSYARQEYDSKKGKLTIEIVDYSLAQQTLKDLMLMYEKNTAARNTFVSLKKEKVNEADIAFSEVNNTDNYASMKLNLGGKYLININGNDSTDISFLKKIVESIKLKKLKEEKM